MARRFSGPNLRAARVAAGLRSSQLAATVGRSPLTLHDYECGQAAPPASVLGALADALGCPIDALYDDDDQAHALRPAAGDLDTLRAPPVAGLVTVTELAHRLGRSPAYVRRLCQLGKLPARRTHRVWLIDRAALTTTSTP